MTLENFKKEERNKRKVGFFFLFFFFKELCELRKDIKWLLSVEVWILFGLETFFGGCSVMNCDFCNKNPSLEDVAF